MDGLFLVRASADFYPKEMDLGLFGPGLRWWRKFVDKFDRLPSRSDMDPEDLTAKALPHVIIVDIGKTSASLRFRLVGTAHVNFNRQDFTGKLFRDVYPEASASLRYVEDLYDQMRSSRRPIWSVNRFKHPRNDSDLWMHRLMLPISSDGQSIDKCVGIQVIQYPVRNAEIQGNAWHGALSVEEEARQIL